jgi:hypothetical protein
VSLWKGNWSFGCDVVCSECNAACCAMGRSGLLVTVVPRIPSDILVLSFIDYKVDRAGSLFGTVGPQLAAFTFFSNG